MYKGMPTHTHTHMRVAGLLALCHNYQKMKSQEPRAHSAMGLASIRPWFCACSMKNAPGGSETPQELSYELKNFAPSKACF